MLTKRMRWITPSLRSSAVLSITLLISILCQGIIAQRVSSLFLANDGLDDNVPGDVALTDPDAYLRDQWRKSLKPSPPKRLHPPRSPTSDTLLSNADDRLITPPSIQSADIVEEKPRVSPGLTEDNIAALPSIHMVQDDLIRTFTEKPIDPTWPEDLQNKIALQRALALLAASEYDARPIIKDAVLVPVDPDAPIPASLSDAQINDTQACLLDVKRKLKKGLKWTLPTLCAGAVTAATSMTATVLLSPVLTPVGAAAVGGALAAVVGPSAAAVIIKAQNWVEEKLALLKRRKLARAAGQTVEPLPTLSQGSDTSPGHVLLPIDNANDATNTNTSSCT